MVYNVFKYILKDVIIVWKQPLCINLVKGLNLDPIEQLRIIKQTGFDGFFDVWKEPGQLDALAEEAQKLSLLFQSIHAPFVKARNMWTEGEDGDVALQELLNCLQDCYRLNVPIMVIHPYIGFDIKPPTQIGIDRFGKVIGEAEKFGVKIAFENVEGEEHLALLFKTYGHLSHVGFCWDTGHEMCYNHHQDMLALYGDKLIATHINDNLGISNTDGIIAPTDDLHLLPFDGIGNWDNIAARLNRCGFDGPLTFELSVSPKRGRHDNDIYAQMPPEQFLCLAYARACRVAAKRGIYGLSSNY